MQAFITKVVEWVVAVDPATLKWAAAVLLAVFFGLLLFGLFQYQAYDRKWGLHLVLGLTGGRRPGVLVLVDAPRPERRHPIAVVGGRPAVEHPLVGRHPGT